MLTTQTLQFLMNQVSTFWWENSLQLLMQSSVLILLIWVVEVLLRNRVHAGFRYGLWMLVLVKLVLPPTLYLPIALASWWPVHGTVKSTIMTIDGGQDATEAFAREAETFDGYEAGGQEAANGIDAGPSGLQYMLWVWVLGVAVLLTIIIQRLFFVRNLLTQSRPVEGRWKDLFNECQEQVGVRGPLQCRLSPTVTSPVVCGLLKPAILLPDHLEQGLNAEQLKEILTHELTHVHRKDLWINFIQTSLNAVYFYHPLVWLANIRIHALREYAVDETVLNTLKRPADQYSQTLVDVAQHGYAQPNLGLRLVGVAECKHQLKGRITHMLQLKSLWSLGGRWCQLVILVLLGLLLLPMARAVESTSDPAKSLNPQQLAYQQWTLKQFGEMLDRSRYTQMSPETQAELETVWLEDLKVRDRRIEAINCLAAIGSQKAVQPILAIAAERVQKDNRERWMAVRALGLLGEPSVVPDLIHLIYHYNQNTRFWAQISLVRLTGQNYGAKWRLWGIWWNKQGGQPAFVSQPIAWTQNEEWADPRKQAEADRSFWERNNGPEVVRSTPETFATDVSADLTEINVTFNQVMRDGGWSWTGGGDTFPQITGDIHYDRSKQICTLPVKLEPGKVYWIGINSPSHQNFKSRRGAPAQRYVILFATAAADGSPTVIPEDLLTRAERINGIEQPMD